MNIAVRELWPALLATYWFLPAVLTAIAVALGGGLVYLDHSAPQHPSGATALFFPTSAEGSRALLSAIVSSMMTVVAVTFSVTIVALTVASQHYGPRLLNSFMRDRTVQLVLGILIGTFAYSIVVLGSAQGESSQPLYWSTTGAMMLVAVSVVALILFIHHVSASLQVSALALQIAGEFGEAVARQYPDAGEGQRASGSQPDGPRLDDELPAAEITSAHAGYVQHLDEGALVRLAQEANAVIRIVREPGRFLITGVVLARVQPADAVDDEFRRRVNAACMLGRDRTARHDIEFAVKQLVEIALRALSPGVNEPFTAIACIDRLGECLGAVARRGRPSVEVRDGNGVVRLIVRRQTFTGLLRAAFDPIRIFAGRNPAIYARLLDTIAALADVAWRQDDIQALRHQAELIGSAGEAALDEAEDATFVSVRQVRALGALDAAARRVEDRTGADAR